MPQSLYPELTGATPPVGVNPIPAPIAHSIDQLLGAISRHEQSVAQPTAQSSSTATHPENKPGNAPTEDSQTHVAKHLAALIDIINRLHDGKQEATASRQLVSDLADHLSSVTSVDVVVSLAAVDEVSLRCRMVAASDVPQIDHNCEKTIARQSAAQESLARTAIAVWPCSDPEHRHALLAQHQLAQSQAAQVAISAPLELADGSHQAVVVCTASWDSETQPIAASLVAQKMARFLHASASALAAALKIRNQLDRPFWQRVATKIRKAFGTARYQICASVMAVGCATMLIPVDYKVTCQLELQPVSRRFVAAPFSAQLKTCFVEPGDIVEAGQILAVLDGREIQWELSGVLSDLEKAKKERNAHLSERSAGLAAIARHEAQRMQNQASLLQARLDQLEIRSPIDGVIVAGDLKDTVGAPLETGQSLFEVAPLEQMKVHVCIPEDDFRHVTTGMATSLQLDAMPSDSMDATLKTIRPMAEVFEDDNVFVAEAELDNISGRFRPGMRGQAKVSTGPKPLGWNLFHKPVAWFVGWLGW